MKIFKQHKELLKLTAELDALQEDKRDLEGEIKSRNEEIYQLNEKLMLLEISQQMNGGGPSDTEAKT